MSQDKSPNTESSAQTTAKPAETSAAETSRDSGSGTGEGKRKDSAIAQPVDALRQPAGKTATSTAGDPSKNNPEHNPHASPQKTPVSSNNPPGSTNTMSSSKQTNESKSRGVWGGVVLGLVLIAAALVAGLWWQQQRFENVAREIATRLQQSDQQLTQASERASQALTIATAQRELVDQLSRELSVTNNELRVLQQAWEAANEGLDQTLLLNDLKRLIGMANQELTLFGNVNSAVSILSSVQSMLKAQPAAPLKNLEQAVTTDLARLRAVPQVDMASLSARLDSLIQLAGKAPLLSPEGQVTSLDSNTGSGSQLSQSQPPQQGSKPTAEQPTPELSASAENDQPWWEAFTDTATTTVSKWTSEASSVFMREFADVMSIRKADDPQALLLSEEQAIQLRANVRAMLLSAQLALMTRQTEIWRSELSEVQSLLNTRFDKQALDTKAAINLLSELLKAPVAADVPQINDTLGALASAERALSIPAESVSGQGSDGTDGSAASTEASSETSNDAAQATGSDTSAATSTESQAPAAQPSQQGN